MRSLAIAVLLLLAGGAVLIVCACSEPAGRTYTVAQIRQALLAERGSLAGRIVLIRGIAVIAQTSFPCSYTGCSLTALVDSMAQPLSAAIWVGQGQPEPLWATLRRLPWASRFAPARQRPLLGSLGTYRIRLLARPDCGHGTCFDALLPDGQAANTNVAIPLPRPAAHPTLLGATGMFPQGTAPDSRHAPRLHLPLGRVHRASPERSPGATETAAPGTPVTAGR